MSLLYGVFCLLSFGYVLLTILNIVLSSVITEITTLLVMENMKNGK